MSNILKAISDDHDEYTALCQKFGEQMQFKDGKPDLYGSHARELGRRAHDEDEAIRIAGVERSAEYRTLRSMLVGLLGRIEDKGLASNFIDADFSLRAWWKNNRKAYDDSRAAWAAEQERERLVKQAKRKLSPKERKVLGV